jgi:UDP-3-O-[3-hydroxymyristoyl] glucosamine N-acyltransferase
VPVNHSVAEIAAWVGGTVHGDGGRQISAALPLDEATAHSVTFLSNPKRLNEVLHRAIGALLVPRDKIPNGPLPFPVIAVDNPLSAILTVAARLSPPAPEPQPGIDPRAAVHPTAQISDDCYVGPFAVVEQDVQLGPGCKIHPHAVLRAGCVLGARVEVHPHAVLYPRTQVGDGSIIHSGAVLGCDGFGYVFDKGKHVKVPQIGVTQIGPDVEVGANTTFGTTRVGEGTKIDNQVMVAHNCQIGAHNILISQVGIAGSCVTGNYVTIAGQTGIADHIHIDDGVVVGAGAAVHCDLPAGQRYLGYPARPEREAKRIVMTMEKLPEMRRQLQEVRQHLGLDKEDSHSRRAAG